MCSVTFSVSILDITCVFRQYYVRVFRLSFLYLITTEHCSGSTGNEILCDFGVMDAVIMRTAGAGIILPFPATVAPFVTPDTSASEGNKALNVNARLSRCLSVPRRPAFPRNVPRHAFNSLALPVFLSLEQREGEDEGAREGGQGEGSQVQ